MVAVVLSAKGFSRGYFFMLQGSREVALKLFDVVRLLVEHVVNALSQGVQTKCSRK